MPTQNKPSILVCQIIVGALMAGVVFFGCMAIFIGLAPAGDDAANDGLPMISLVMCTFAVVAVMARFVVPPALVAQQRSRATSNNEEEELVNFLGLFQTKTILENALPEGACFALIVSYIVEGQWWVLAVVAGLLAIMAIGFPTQSKFDNWYRAQRELAGMDR